MEIDNKKISKWIKDNKKFHFLDVRTIEERNICHLAGLHIPLNELENRHEEIPRDKSPIIVYCHHGVRSLYATQFLKFHGYDALSLRGGLEQWSLEIDPDLARY
jgi:rhodanese-related sulfurtransferase